MPTTHTCTICQKQTVSVVPTDTGWVCFECYHSGKAKKEKRVRNNEEEQIQSEFFRSVKFVFPQIPDKLLFAVPNGGSRNKIEAVNLKRQGVKSGISDVILLIPRGGFSALCLEFKAKTGIQSAEQKEFQIQAENNGNKYVIVRSTAQAIEEVRNYLLLK